MTVRASFWATFAGGGDGKARLVKADNYKFTVDKTRNDRMVQIDVEFPDDFFLDSPPPTFVARLLDMDKITKDLEAVRDEFGVRGT